MIGIFDSGYGGLTVFKPLSKHFPEIEKRLGRNRSRRLVTTGDPGKFSAFTEKYLNVTSREFDRTTLVEDLSTLSASPAAEKNRLN